jgi:hypothetical protein
MSDKKIIVITKHEKGYDARLKNNPKVSGWGKTIKGAVGDMVFFKPSHFGINIEMPKIGKPEAK